MPVPLLWELVWHFAFCCLLSVNPLGKSSLHWGSRGGTPVSASAAFNTGSGSRSLQGWGPLPPRLLRADLKPSPGLPGAPRTVSCFSGWQVFSCLPQVSCKLEFLGALTVPMFTCGHFIFEPDLIFDEIFFFKEEVYITLVGLESIEEQRRRKEFPITTQPPV